MKAIKFLLFCASIIVISSCSEERTVDYDTLNYNEAPKSLVYRLKNKNNYNKVDAAQCDGASGYAISVQTDFDFKRPITDCTSGFWFCTETTTYLQCLDADGEVIYQVDLSTMLEGIGFKKYSVSLIELDNDEIVLSFPKEYFENGDYSSSDLEYFSVDKALEILPKTLLIEGNYNVYSYEDNLIVLLPIKNV